MPAKAKPVARAKPAAVRDRTARPHNRTKLSTTVAAENFAFLEAMVDAGRTESIAKAVDFAISRLRRAENRARLERATIAYFNGLSPEAQAEEQALAHQFHAAIGELDFDLEY